MLALLNTFTILASSDFPIRKHLLRFQAPQHLYLCLFRERSPPIGFFLPQKTRISQKNPFFKGFVETPIGATKSRRKRRTPSSFSHQALSTNACRSFHFASSGMFPIQSFFAGSSVLQAVRLVIWERKSERPRSRPRSAVGCAFPCLCPCP